MITPSVHNQFFRQVSSESTEKVIKLPFDPVSPSQHLKRQTWSREEHERFMQGLERYPTGPWKAIADHVGTRTVRQTMTHGQKYREKIARRKRGLRSKTQIELERRAAFKRQQEQLIRNMETKSHVAHINQKKNEKSMKKKREEKQKIVENSFKSLTSYDKLNQHNSMNFKSQHINFSSSDPTQPSGDNTRHDMNIILQLPPLSTSLMVQTQSYSPDSVSDQTDFQFNQFSQPEALIFDSHTSNTSSDAIIEALAAAYTSIEPTPFVGGDLDIGEFDPMLTETLADFQPAVVPAIW